MRECFYNVYLALFCEEPPEGRNEEVMRQLISNISEGASPAGFGDSDFKKDVKECVLSVLEGEVIFSDEKEEEIAVQEAIEAAMDLTGWTGRRDIGVQKAISLLRKCEQEEGALTALCH